MHLDDACETEILAKSKFCMIAHCRACNSFHLHFGAISLRLREEIFRDICETMAGVYVRTTENSGERPARNH